MELKQLINKYNIKQPIQNFNNNYVKNSNSFFDIKINRFKIKNEDNLDFKEGKKIKNNLKCEKIILEPDKYQKKKILGMLESCRLVYNYTNNIMKKMKFKKIPKWNYIRTYFIKDYIKKINLIYKTPIHTLDYSVNECVKNYKACETNKNTKKYNVRYKKRNKNYLNMTLEKETLRDKKFIPTIFKKEIKNKSNISYLSNHNVSIYYDRKKDLIYLIKAVDIINNNKKKDKNFISIDPGIRTFLNCIDNESFIEIGSKLKLNIKKDLNKLDYLNKKNNRKYIKKREKLREKLKNKKKDLHWKSIQFLISNYNNILIGKLSTSDIIKNDKSVLNKINKRLILFLEHFKFRERLIYKCSVNNVNILEIDEHYTSKTCSNCGNIKKDLGCSKIYNCNKCCISIDRDYNGCRNILFKGLK